MGPFYLLDHIDDKVEFFNDVILALFNRHCLVTRLRLKSEKTLDHARDA
jgi:hypothetical protein